MTGIAAKYPDIEEAFWPLYERVRPFTMTSPEKLYDLYQAVRYVIRAKIPGAMIECGVWKGGSAMLMAELLKAAGETRRLLLFDTFEGLPPPDPDIDVDLLGNVAAERYRERWAYASREEVESNMASVGYPRHMLIAGMVERTLPQFAHYNDLVPPGNYPGLSVPIERAVALARLDTDWYASTKVELEVLWPLLSPGGILIIDDYGHWQGARKATDEFFADKPVRMTRVDYSCRVIQK